MICCSSLWRVSTDRLAASNQPDRLALLYRRTTLRSAALHRGVRRLRAVGEFRVAWGRVPSLVLDVDRVHLPLGTSILDAAVPRWTTTVKMEADRCVGGAMRIRVGRIRGGVHAGTAAHTLLR